jgi:hypothetical protein
LNLQISFENDASPSKPCCTHLTSDLEEMNLETYYDYCLSKKGFSFDEDVLVFKVGIYALSPLMHWEKECRLLI